MHIKLWFLVCWYRNRSEQGDRLNDRCANSKLYHRIKQFMPVRKNLCDITIKPLLNSTESSKRSLIAHELIDRRSTPVYSHTPRLFLWKGGLRMVGMKSQRPRALLESRVKVSCVTMTPEVSQHCGSEWRTVVFQSHVMSPIATAVACSGLKAVILEPSWICHRVVLWSWYSLIEHCQDSCICSVCKASGPGRKSKQQQQ